MESGGTQQEIPNTNTQIQVQKYKCKNAKNINLQKIQKYKIENTKIQKYINTKIQIQKQKYKKQMHSQLSAFVLLWHPPAFGACF